MMTTTTAKPINNQAINIYYFIKGDNPLLYIKLTKATLTLKGFFFSVDFLVFDVDLRVDPDVNVLSVSRSDVSKKLV